MKRISTATAAKILNQTTASIRRRLTPVYVEQHRNYYSQEEVRPAPRDSGYTARKSHDKSIVNGLAHRKRTGRLVKNLWQIKKQEPA